MIQKTKIRVAWFLVLVMIVTWLVPSLQVSASELPEGTKQTVSENILSKEPVKIPEEAETELYTEDGETDTVYSKQSITVQPNGALELKQSAQDVWDAVSYLKVNGDGTLSKGTADDYNFYYNKAESAITLNNFQYQSPDLNNQAGDENNAGWAALGFYATVNGQDAGENADSSSYQGLNLILEGENVITSPTGSAIDIPGSVTITGSGTLKAVTTYAVGTQDPEAADRTNYFPAVFVGGSFTSSCSITCDAQNSGDHDMLVSADMKNVVIKAGNITGRVLIGGENGGFYDGLVPYTTQWTDQSGLTFVGRAYYFTKDTFYPNQIAAKLGERECRIIGRYDADGHPIPSNQFYQGYYVHKNGGPITNDFHYPVMYLIYDDSATVDAQITANDIVDVADGKAHTFQHDLYALHILEGSAVVNGDVTLDLACFEQYGRAGETEDGYTIYERDGNGNIVYSGDSRNASAVVNGNVGALSLNSSFRGDISVTGNVNFIAYYDDIHAEDGKPVPETYYGSMVSAGKVIDKGSFVAKVAELRGFQGRGMFENTYYPKTATTVNGESVQGTSAPIGTDALLINVGANGIDDVTYPCVRETDSATLEEISEALTDQSSKISAMDITLIQDDTTVVEPSQTVNLYIDNLTGFTKPALFHIKADGSVEKLYAFSGNTFEGNIACPTNEFSTYFVAENQEIAMLPVGPDTWKGKTGTDGFVLRLYNLALGREADEKGFQYWNQRLLKKESTAAEVAQRFFFSKEFQSAQYTDIQYVKLLYRTMLGREADKAGLNYWMELLENGVSREYVFKGFAASQEFTSVCKEYGVERGSVSVSESRDKNPAVTGFVARLYTKMLGRSYDTDGLNYWCEKNASGMSIEEIATIGFLHSKELQNQNLSDSEFVTRMYQTFLNREPDEEGYQYWLAQLKSGKTTRDNLVYGFTHSKEFAKLKASYGLR